MKSNFLLFILCIFFIPVMGQDKKLYETDTYFQRMAYFKDHPLEKGQIVFLGNSLTQGGKWNDYFPDKNVANRGISGDNTDGMLSRLDEIIESEPEKLFFLGGINDVSQNADNKAILHNIKTVIERVKAGSPNTIIFVQSPLPVNNSFGRYHRLINKEGQIEKLVKEIAKLCRKEDVRFIDLYPSFLIEKRLLNPDFTTDGLHLNEKGYTVWVSVIRPFVEE
ncbi:MAG: GDSL-type esterase/lipase family protein [Dysgonomonas sp.]